MKMKVKKEVINSPVAEEKVTHPAFGMIGFSRTTGTPEVLFGSNIKHRDTIVMRLKHGEETRSLHKDYYFGKDTIVEVEMSYAQFAEAITSLNCGNGVPCTIRYEQGKGEIPRIAELQNKQEQFQEEFQSKIQKAMKATQEQIDIIQETLNSKKTFGIKDRNEMITRLNSIQANIGSNLDFCAKQFESVMDKITQDAKAEIESFTQNRINSIIQMDPNKKLLENSHVTEEKDLL